MVVEEKTRDPLAELTVRLEALESKANLPAVIGASPQAGGRSAAPEAGASSPVEGIDRRIAEAEPGDALRWVQVRGEMIKQDEFARDRSHVRRFEKLEFGAKVALSTVAIAAGAGLAFGGFGFPAFLCLGAGLYGLAPNFVDKVTKRFIGGGSGE